MNGARKKVVAVTGAARGIGRNIARLFASKGNCVYICDVDQGAAAKAVRDLQGIGLEVRAHIVDLGIEGAAQRMVREIVGAEGRLDVLVNNAQSKERCGFLEETERSWNAGLSVTLRAAFFAAQEAVRCMRLSGGGAIVNIASVAGFIATQESPSYHAAKAGLMHMSRYLAIEGGRFGVRVNCVCPGFVVQDEHLARFDADDNAEYRSAAAHCHPFGNVGASDDVAEAVFFLCSEQARFINGQSIVLDGGATIQEQFGLLRSYAARLKN